MSDIVAAIDAAMVVHSGIQVVSAIHGQHQLLNYARDATLQHLASPWHRGGRTPPGTDPANNFTIEHYTDASVSKCTNLDWKRYEVAEFCSISTPAFKTLQVHDQQSGNAHQT